MPTALPAAPREKSQTQSAESGEGELCWPKIFRRQCTLLARGGELARALPRYSWRALVEALGESEERAVEREAFLRELAGGEAARRLRWGEIVGERGELKVAAGEVVWEEK